MNNIENENITKEELVDLITIPEEKRHTEHFSVEELKKAGMIRDINDINMDEVVKEIQNNVSIQKNLNDYRRNSTDNKSIKDYILEQINFLVSISNKNEKEIIKSLTVEQVKAYLKTTAKMSDDSMPEALIKKHLKTLKKKII